MIKKLKDIKIYGLIFTILSILFVMAFGTPFFIEERLQPYLYNIGIDSMGAIICAALFMMSSKIYINDHATMGGSPAEILERVNKLVYANNDAHMFVTVWLGILGIALLVALIVFLSFKLLFLIVNIMYDITYGRDDAERGESGRRVKKSDSDFFFG